MWLCLDNTSLCIDCRLESCKITVFLFGSILPNLKGHRRGGLSSRNRGVAHPISHSYVHCSYKISVLFLFAITAAGIVTCGGPKKSPRTPSIVQFIFPFSLLRYEIRNSSSI